MNFNIVKPSQKIIPLRVAHENGTFHSLGSFKEPLMRTDFIWNGNTCKNDVNEILFKSLCRRPNGSIA